MSDYSTTFQVACVPGRKASAAMTRGPGGRPVLVVYLDPVNMTLYSNASGMSPRELAMFFRELAGESAKLAAEIDPDGEPKPSGPRHLWRGDAVSRFGEGEAR